MLQAAFALPSRLEQISLPAALATVSLNPAKAAGLEDRGEIAIGKRGDLVRVRMVGDLPVVRGVWRQGQRVS
jgi:alpha-D-ribose 1-methylphosphonate 5-triphosphate diphosphatase